MTPPGDEAGPRVARLLQQSLSLVLLCAWLSLLVQLRVLMGSHGLSPAAHWVEALSVAKIGFWAYPSWLRITGASDTIMFAGVWLGIALALFGTAGKFVRVGLFLQAPLYLGLTLAGGTFFHFQWDQLFVESAVLVALLPRDRRSSLALFLVRALLFKLYFESGIAKAESHLGDWWNGSAMTHYYETAPLPASLAYWMHTLPRGWHHLESWVTLGLELGLPCLFFVPKRRIRLVAALALTGFQILNWATANYGFFVPLAVVLHLSLVGERDVARLGDWLRRRLRRPTYQPENAHPRRSVTVALGVFAAAWLSASTVEALDDFAGLTGPLMPVRRLYLPFQLFNTYHLFGHITIDRIEPELQTTDDDITWTAHPLRYQPADPRGPLQRASPHQPRVAFQMWFYGLAPQRTPLWVRALVDHVCNEPATVESLFMAPLPPHPKAVRLVFWKSQFSTPDDRRATGMLWTRTLQDQTNPVICDTQNAAEAEGS